MRATGKRGVTVTMTDSTQRDVIVVGGGHNGLAAAAVLAARDLDVLVLEKNGYVGGMTGTREILPGCRNEVGASCLERTDVVESVVCPGPQAGR